MPVFKSGKGLAPGWCEMEYFDITELAPGDTHAFERVGEKEKLIVCRGKCRISVGDRTIDVEQGANLDLSAPGEAFEIVDVQEDSTLIRMCGRWGDAVGGSGIFPIWPAEDPHDGGDPVPYPKETSFDNHFHDCDEYWIFFSGRCIAVSEGRFYEVGPGDCVVTGMGHHHDVQRVIEPGAAVFFETTMEGEKRPGHLWEHTHGPAEPKPERV